MSGKRRFTDEQRKERKKAYMARYRAANKQRILIENRAYGRRRRSDPAKVEMDRAVYKRWYARNRPRLLVRARRYAKSYNKDPKNKAALRAYKIKNKDRIAEWLSRNKDRYVETRWRRLHDKHGITTEFYRTMLKAQNSACAICRQPAKNERLTIDHDHRCCAGGWSCGCCIRGLLCRRCNGGLGCFSDNPVLMKKAIAYLEREAM